MLTPTQFALNFDRLTARATQTSGGRIRHDLYFTAVTLDAKTLAQKTALGFASSFTGDQFHVGAASILPLHVDSCRAPSETSYGDSDLLLYVDHAGARDAIAAALSP